MARKPNGGYTARIKYVPTPDAAERYARVLEILLRAKKRIEARELATKPEDRTPLSVDEDSPTSARS